MRNFKAISTVAKIILLLIALFLAAAFILFYNGPVGPNSPYRRFHKKNSDYYSRLAHACDSLLQQHTNFTKPSSYSPEAVIWIDANNVVWNQTQISASDSSLPSPIKELNPDEIFLAPNRVWMGFGHGRVGWGVSWGQDGMQTNNWVLQSGAEGLAKKVYSEIR